MPLFDGLRLESRHTEERAREAEAEAAVRDTRLRVETDVRTALVRVATAREAVVAARVRLDLAEREVAQARERFRAGLSNNADVINASITLNGARDVAISQSGFTFNQNQKKCTGSCHGYDHAGTGWTGEGGVYHPAGFAAAAMHGTEMELQRQDCRGCHGADLAGGSAVSCDGCHQSGWRTDCTYCHGGGLDDTRFTGAGRPQKKHRADGARRVIHARQIDLEQSAHAADGSLLANDLCRELIFELGRPRTLAVGVEQNALLHGLLFLCRFLFHFYSPGRKIQFPLIPRTLWFSITCRTY
jgi:hypothetical protein